MKLLLNGFVVYSRKGFVKQNYNKLGNLLKGAYHQTILNYHDKYKFGENFEIQENGNDYVLNYNPETYYTHFSNLL